jgi:hypothetical protein
MAAPASGVGATRVLTRKSIDLQPLVRHHHHHHHHHRHHDLLLHHHLDHHHLDHHHHHHYHPAWTHTPRQWVEQDYMVERMITHLTASSNLANLNPNFKFEFSCALSDGTPASVGGAGLHGGAQGQGVRASYEDAPHTLFKHLKIQTFIFRIFESSLCGCVVSSDGAPASVGGAGLHGGAQGQSLRPPHMKTHLTPYSDFKIQSFKIRIFDFFCGCVVSSDGAPASVGGAGLHCGAQGQGVRASYEDAPHTLFKRLKIQTFIFRIFESSCVVVWCRQMAHPRQWVEQDYMVERKAKVYALHMKTHFTPFTRQTSFG